MHSTRYLTAFVLALLAACGNNEPTQPDPDAISLTHSLVTVSRPALLPGDTATITLQTRNAAGQAVTDTGLTVVFSASGGTSVGTLQPVVDHHNGTFTTIFTATMLGTALTIRAQIDGAAVTSTAPTLRAVGFTRIAASGATEVGATTTTGGHTCGIITTGEMYCWGQSAFGVRGNGTVGEMAPGLVPTLVGGGHQWIEVASGVNFLCAIATDNTAYCWGDADVGQLGNGVSGGGSTSDVRIPAPVTGTARFRAVSTGLMFSTCGITVSGAAMCWGSGNWGRVGNGDDTHATVPTAVSGGLTFDALSTGDGGTCGIAASHAYCWGYNTMLGDSGALHDSCNGGTACAKTPVLVLGGHTYRAIIAQDGNVTCAVATDDKTYCWGSGYLGDGTSEIAWGPRLVSGGLTFTALAGGDSFHCGIATGGAAYCWGANKNGRLGSSVTEALVPTVVTGSHTFTQLSMGQDHMCGVATDGNAFCWGGNDRGELGDRTQTATSTPVRVRLFY